MRDAVAILVAEAEAAERRAARVEANRPRVTPKELREAIAEAIAQHSANDVEGICDAVGMHPGRPGDDPMRSKRVYVGRRLTNVRGHELVAVARNLDADYGLPDVAGLAANYLSQIMTEDIPVAYRPNNHLSELPGWEAVGRSWKAATEKVVRDPEGAITAARTTLESVCKHICDERNVDYSSTTGDLSKLFTLAANAMEVAPDQYQDETIKQILRGIVTIVGGLASMRNGMSDSHGRGKSSPRPVPRHAKLAVSTALGVADFLIDAHVEKKLPPTP